jgi:hypothetical protein
MKNVLVRLLRRIDSFAHDMSETLEEVVSRLEERYLTLSWNHRFSGQTKLGKLWLTYLPEDLLKCPARKKGIATVEIFVGGPEHEWEVIFV